MAKKKEIQEVKPKYTLGEEIVNAITHGVGAALAIAGLVLLIIKADSAMGVVTGIIYASIMIVLYVISCIYHSLSFRIKGKKVLRILDHCNIQLMVAGTYTPICLSMLGGTLGWVMFGIVWAVTIVAVVFNCLNVEKYKVVSIVCNLLLGWAALLIIKPLIAACPSTGLSLLIWGGVVYSIGAILYGLGHKVRYMHSVFHFFVIGGSLLHYLMIFFYAV
ncbi:MAG: hemolysin III family protein [Firmicutes bacterium]|nr:hemolysin III family protein [Bacillota bacterium]